MDSWLRRGTGLAVGVSIFAVIGLTSERTWERAGGLCVCAVAVVLLSCMEWERTRKLGWAVLGVGLTLLVVADLVHNSMVDRALYAAIGAVLVASFVLLNWTSLRRHS